MLRHVGITMRHYVLINGIMVNPADADTWTDRTEIEIQNKTSDKVVKYEYFTDPFTRLFRHKSHVRAVAEIINQLEGDVVVVCHSHGCAIACDALPRIQRPISKIHLFAAACNPNFERNNINKFMSTYSDTQIKVYCSTYDSVLKLAAWTVILAPLGLRYYALGREGPRNIKYPSHVHVVWRQFGHNEWFDKKNFSSFVSCISR